MVQRHQFTAASAESVGSHAFISLALGRNRVEQSALGPPQSPKTTRRIITLMLPLITSDDADCAGGDASLTAMMAMMMTTSMLTMTMTTVDGDSYADGNDNDDNDDDDVDGNGIADGDGTIRS